jgi:hypothetical protein
MNDDQSTIGSKLADLGADRLLVACCARDERAVLPPRGAPIPVDVLPRESIELRTNALYIA